MKIGAVMSSLSAFLFRNPAFALRRREIFFSIAPRVVTDGAGRRLRQMIDFFVGRLRRSWAVLERPASGRDRVSHDGCGRVFEWREGRRAMRRFKRSRKFAAMSREVAAVAARLEREVEGAFGVRIGNDALVGMISSAILFECAAVPLLRKWFRRLRVRCVVVSVYYEYTNLAATKAAHDEGLPVVELQHGTIYPAHAAYNLPVEDSPYSPDYLLGWGAYWLRQTRNFPRNRAIPAGYPFLEDALVRHPRKPHGGRPLVLFISQGTVGKRLSELAVEVSRMLEKECRIVFKPHPNEMRSWRTLYPMLNDSDVEVAEDPTRSIYSWLADADAAVGVYSTAMIEGFVWGVKAYVFRPLPGADTMASFCRGGAAEYIDCAADLAARLRLQFVTGTTGVLPFNRTDFFADHAAANIAAAIDQIAEGKVP